MPTSFSITITLLNTTRNYYVFVHKPVNGWQVVEIRREQEWTYTEPQFSKSAAVAGFILMYRVPAGSLETKRKIIKGRSKRRPFSFSGGSDCSPVFAIFAPIRVLLNQY